MVRQTIGLPTFRKSLSHRPFPLLSSPRHLPFLTPHNHTSSRTLFSNFLGMRMPVISLAERSRGRGCHDASCLFTSCLSLGASPERRGASHTTSLLRVLNKLSDRTTAMHSFRSVFTITRELSGTNELHLRKHAHARARTHTRTRHNLLSIALES